MRFLIIILFFPIMTFAQSKCETKKVTYALQLFSTKSVELFDRSKIDSIDYDSLKFEEVCVNGEKRFRVIIPQDSEMQAYETKSRYSKTYKDCFIVKYIDNKRYN